MIRILILAASIAAGSAFTPAFPQESAGERRQVVSFADLDLSKQSDLRTLDRRLTAAVADVCGVTSDADPAGKNAVRRCRAETAASLRAQRERAIARRTGSAITVATRER